MNPVTTNFTALRTLRRQVGELEGIKVQVGLFSDTAGRVAGPNKIQDNPSLGFGHEFGCIKTKNHIPERSFLRMPLSLHLGKAVEALGIRWLAVMMKQGTKRVLGLLGALGEDSVQEAFATRGYGVWPSLSQSTINRKGSSAILIESAQMRKAVSSRVV